MLHLMYVRYALAFLTAAAMGLTVFIVQESGMFRGNVSSDNSSFGNVSSNVSSYTASSYGNVSSVSCKGVGDACGAADGLCCSGSSCLWSGSAYRCAPTPASSVPSCGTEGDSCGSGCCGGYACDNTNVCRWVGGGTTGGVGTTGGTGTTGGSGGSSEPPTPACGNGDVESGEACDDGNTDLSDACVACQTATCGDGHVRSGIEQCDDGNQNNADTCTTSCTVAAPVCGNGIVQVGEQCDDGNTTSNDACVGSCKNARCGDGFVRTGTEQCDDGNSVNTDGCSNACTRVTASSVAPASSAKSSSASSQCPQTCTGADLLYTLSLGVLGSPGTCTTSCPGSSSSPASSVPVSSARSSAKSSAASSAPAGVCCKIKTDENGYQEGVVACMFTATRAACETVPANKWLPGETSIGSCQTTCLLPDLDVHVSLEGIFGASVDKAIEVGGFQMFTPTVMNNGEGVAKDVTTTITLASPLKPMESFTPIVNNGTCTINAARTVITCKTPLLSPGALFGVTMMVELPANASPMPGCTARMPATVSTSTVTTEMRTDNNSQTQNYFPNCGVCCPDPESGTACTSADQKPKASCDTTNPFYTPTWLPSPNTCANCPKASSSSSASAAPKQACCTYTGDAGWNVLSCTPKEKKSDASEICHDIVPGTLLKSDWRSDIAISDCTPAKAQEVCAKGGIDLKLTKTYTGPSQPKVGDELSYELEVTNVTDGDPAVDVTVNDFRNSNLQFVRATGATCSVLGISQAVSCDLDNLAPGASKKITLVFKLLDRGTSGCTVTNTALVYADNKETMISDNYANSPVNAYCWGGSSPASSAAASAVSSKKGGSCCMRLENKKWVPGSLFPRYNTACVSVAGESACSAKKGTTITTLIDDYLVDTTHYTDSQQCAALNCAEYVSQKPCCNNGCSMKTPYECTQGGGAVGTKSNCESTNVCPIASSVSSTSKKSSARSSSSSSAGPSTDISIKKELAPVAAGAKRKPGDKVVYTVTLTNHGEVEATGVKISDLFPSNLSVVSMPSNCTDIPGLITCEGITVPARGTKVVTIEATINEPPSICTNTYSVGENRASVSASPQFDKNGTNNITSTSGFDIDCPTWEVKKEFVTTGTYAKGQTVKFKLSFKRIGGKYTPNGSGYDNDYFDDLGTNLDFVTVPTGCAVSDMGSNIRRLMCQFPPVAKDATHVVEVTATIKQTVCDAGNSGKFSNAVTAKRGKFTASDKVLGTSSVDGTVDCGKEEVKYCCSNNACVEKKSGVSCSTTTEYPGSPADCGGACGGTPKYCCTTGNQCGIRGATGVSCKDSAVFSGSNCNGACPPAPKQYCCTAGANQCAQVVGGTACKEGSVPGTDANCGGLCKPAPVKAFCCTATANSCATEQTLTNGKCASPKAGKSESGYETAATCESACNGAWKVSVALETEGELRVGQKATFITTVTRLGAAYDATTGSAKAELIPDFLEDVTFSQQTCALNAGGTGTCTLPSMSKGGTFDVTVTGTIAAGACSNKLGKINLVVRAEGVEGSAPGTVKCEGTRGGCCAKNLLDEDMACNFNLSEDDCDDVAGQTWYGESCESKCGTKPVSACAEGCFPALANGVCPVDPGMVVSAPTTTWGKLVAWLTGAPLKADLMDVGGGCCCPPSGGTTGGTGGSTTGGGGGSAASAGGTSSVPGGSQASVATSRASSSAPTGKQCGICSGTSQTACENGPNLCQWKGSTFGFVTVLFGGASGTCAPAPQCVGGGTSSVSKASVASSATSAASKASSKSSISPEEYIWYVIGLTPFDAPDCSDGEDNDQDGRIDSEDPGCYDTLMAESTLSRFAAAVGLIVKPWGTYLPQRASELCDPGMFETEGKCVALPMCPEVTGNVQQDKVNALLKCGAGCQGNSRCTGICACNCTAKPGDAADAMEDVQVCFNTCLARTSHPLCIPGPDGKTPQGSTPAECCRAQCVSARCGA
jgi:uncharacterized repeat protein (TIGR01451 family)